MCQNTAATSGRHKHREMVSVVGAGRQGACKLAAEVKIVQCRLFGHSCQIEEDRALTLRAP